MVAGQRQFRWASLLLLLWVTKLNLVDGEIEEFGGMLCNTNDDKVLVREFATSEDATIFGNQPKIAAGREKFVVGRTRNGIRRALLKFDMTELNSVGFPSDTNVVCAEIRLYAVPRSDEERETVPVPKTGLHKVVSDWSTTGKTVISNANGGFAKEGDSTWEFSSYPSSPWQQLGGDFDPDLLCRETLADDLHWFGSTPKMNQVVQAWLDGSSPNYGFMLVGDETSSKISYSIYHGFENAPEFVPRLIVTYTSPAMGKPHLQTADEILETVVDPPVPLPTVVTSPSSYGGQSSSEGSGKNGQNKPSSDKKSNSILTEAEDVLTKAEDEKEGLIVGAIVASAAFIVAGTSMCLTMYIIKSRRRKRSTRDAAAATSSETWTGTNAGGAIRQREIV